MPAEIDQDLPPDDSPANSEPRARARRASPSEDSEGQDDSDLDTEIEALAREIEVQAPRAGETCSQIIGAHPSVRRMIVAAAVRALGAKKWWYDAKKRRRIVEPDYALTFKAAEFLADRADGRPAQAVLSVNLTPARDGQADDRLWESSSAVREAMRRALDRAERRAKPVEST